MQKTSSKAISLKKSSKEISSKEITLKEIFSKAIHLKEICLKKFFLKERHLQKAQPTWERVFRNLEEAVEKGDKQGQVYWKQETKKMQSKEDPGEIEDSESSSEDRKSR